jgi:acyl carrier protein
VDTNDKAYELHILKKVIDSYLDERVSATEEGLNLLLYTCDELVWAIATRIYTQSGHKVEFSTIRDVINSRTKILKTHVAAEKAEAFQQRAEIEKRVATGKVEAEKHRKNRLILLSKQLEVSGRNNSMSDFFLTVQDIVSKQLSVDVGDIALDASFSNDLGADESDFSQLVMSLEEEFDTEIPDCESENLSTVGQLVDYIHKQLERSSEKYQVRQDAST